MIADILVADCGGQGWLVRGEQYIDDFLANTLPAHVTATVVTCESKTALAELRRTYAGPDDTEDVMWMIHPAIMNRVRGQGGEYTIAFAEWSASLSESALAAVQAVHDAALQQPGYVLALVRYLPQDAPAMTTAMADLRCGLLEAQLAALGMPAGRIIRESRDPATPDHANRIDLLLRPH